MEREASPYVGSQWGPVWWMVLHGAALAYPLTPEPEQVGEMRAFVTSFFAVLPCHQCRKRVEPPSSALAGRANLLKWTLEMHMDVCTRLGKASSPMDVLLLRGVQ